MPAIRRGDFQFDFPTEVLERGLVLAPVATYFWLRDAVGAVFGRHRRDWIRQKRIKFGSRKAGIRVGKVNERLPNDHRSVIYRVDPAEQRRKDAPVDEIHGETYTHSEALESLQKGTTIKPKRGQFLAIPIKPRQGRAVRRSPREFRKRMRKSSRLLYLENKRGTPFLAERVRKRTGQRRRAERTRTGRVRKNQRKTFRDTLIPRWALVRAVRMPKALGYYETWDRGAGDRDRTMKRAADRLVKDIANGITT